MSAAPLSIVPFLQKISAIIINPLITLMFAIALLIFFWGIVQFINSETVEAKRDVGKRKIIWGLVGMFIMISAYGLIKLILNTIGVSGPTYPGF